MKAYIFNKETSQIVSKIENVNTIISNEIFGDSIIKLGELYDYIVLEDDNINFDIGNEIELNSITDCRDYFLLGEDKWKIKQLQEQNNKLNEKYSTMMNTLVENSIISTDQYKIITGEEYV